MARVLLSGCLLLFIALCVSAEQIRYDGYELWQVHLRHEDDVQFLEKLRDDFPHVDFWTDPIPRNNMTVLVPPGLLELVKTKLDGVGMTYDLMTKDIQRMVEATLAPASESDGTQKRATSSSIVNHYDYHRYGKIVDYLNALAYEYPNNMVVSNLDYQTFDGQDVKMVKLSGSTGSKRSIIIESGIHAREWITPAATLWAIEHLLQGYRSGDATARMMLDNYDWYIVPVTNPDGYEYSHTAERMWRKNRSVVNSRCVGVDLNRNFDIDFGNTGVSSRCESDIYPGRSAFSEAETQNIRNLFDSLYGSLIAYMSVHAYSQYLLVPWGYTTYVYRPANSQELDRVASLMNSAMSNRHGKTYKMGTAWQLLRYAASGSSKDWALMEKGDLYSMAYELRPHANSPYGFLLPTNEIIPASEEYFDSLAVLAREMKH